MIYRVTEDPISALSLPEDLYDRLKDKQDYLHCGFTKSAFSPVAFNVCIY